MKISAMILAGLLFGSSTSVFSQEELIKYGDFEKWITRNIKESSIVGGNTKTLMEVGPTTTINRNEVYHNMGGSPWATSNVYAKVAGIVKTNTSVYKDNHKGGACAKLITHIETCKAIGLINIKVLAAGSLFTGEMQEPITGTSDPMSKISIGIPFAKRPKALKFDYKVQLSNQPNRIRETGFSRVKEIAGKDYPNLVCILQKRWEDENGNIHALRVGTAIHRFKSSCDWKEGQAFTINYGDITHASYFKSWMGLMTGENSYYALNSKGKNVRIIEEGWADANATPTHLIVKFDSSYGGAYIGSPGTTLWIDNVKLVY